MSGARLITFGIGRVRQFSDDPEKINETEEWKRRKEEAEKRRKDK
jgi:hypothetical protein